LQIGFSEKLVGATNLQSGTTMIIKKSMKNTVLVFGGLLFIEMPTAKPLFVF